MCRQRDQDNYDRPIWQQATRLKEDPRDLKKIVRTALETAESREAFEKNLKDHGLHLAQGTKRSFVVVHHCGEPMSLTRYSGMRKKEVERRIGTADRLPTLDQVQSQLNQQDTKVIRKRMADLKSRQHNELLPLRKEHKAMRQLQREERVAFRENQSQRWNREALNRANRLRKGIMGLWDRVTGRHGRVARQNEQEIRENRRRDLKEFHEVRSRQLTERRELQIRIDSVKQAHKTELKKLVKELGHSVEIPDKALSNEFNVRVQDRPLEQKKEPPKEQVKDEGRLSDIFGGSSTWNTGDMSVTYSFNLGAGVPEEKEPSKDKKQDKGRERNRNRDPEN